MKMDSAVDEIRKRFGFYSIQRAILSAPHQRQQLLYRLGRISAIFRLERAEHETLFEPVAEEQAQHLIPHVRQIEGHVRAGAGDFSISINSIGAESAADYSPAIHVRKLNVNWSAGTRFQNLQEEAVFNLVATRKAARLVVKALKAGKTSVDLTGEAKEPENGGQA